jgi:hypothetical protein
VSVYGVVITHLASSDAHASLTGELAPEAWGARDAQEFADDLARCLRPGHRVEVWDGPVDGRADAEARS